MSEGRWDALERLFEEGLLQPPEQRAAWLARLDVDAGLRHELAAMLAADAGSVELTQRFDAAIVQAGDAPLPGARLGAYRLL